MPEKIADKGPPKGLLLLLFRLPRWLYRWRLGFLLGDRFLLLRHIGRVSGKPHETVLEVVHHDRQTDAYYVAAAYGTKADWYQNLLHSPIAGIRTGRRSLVVHAETVDKAEGGEVLAGYARRHPHAIRELTRFLGYRVDGTEQDYRLLGEMIPLVALEPDEGAKP